MPLDQHSWQQQVKALENYLVHAVLNLQTLERAQVSPLRSLKQTPNASKELLATELEQSIEQNRMRLSEALKYYASLANLEGKPDSFAYARDRSLALASSVVTETERCFDRTFRWRLLEGTLPADLNDRLHAVRYLREGAQKLAAFVERKNYDLAVDLSQTVYWLTELSSTRRRMAVGWVKRMRAESSGMPRFNTLRIFFLLCASRPCC